jgi:aryl-alcohol dehydrogenase-like predicted oxidoreductase
VQYTYLGSSGLQVSRLALGCMSFGRPDPGRPWALDEESADPIFRQAVELGITFWDTANVLGITLCPSVRRSLSRRKAQTWSSSSFHSVGNRSQVVVAATTAVGLSAAVVSSTRYSMSR